MFIADIRLTGLSGGTVEGGWAEELVPDDNIHTIVEVLTDDGRTGIGSVYTSQALVEGGGQAAAAASSSASGPTSRRASARSCGSTPSGRAAAGRSSTPSAASTSPCGTSSARSRTSRCRVCSAATTARRSSPTARCSSMKSIRLREKLKAAVARGFKAIKLGWRPFGRRDAKTDELLDPHGTRDGRAGRGDDGRCRRQRRLLAARLQVGAANGADAGRTTTWSGSRKRCRRTTSRASSNCAGTRRCRSRRAKCSRGGRASGRSSSSSAWTSCSPTAPSAAV